MIQKKQTHMLSIPALVLVLQACTSLDERPAVVNSQSVVPQTGSENTLADGSIRHDTNNARIAQLWAAAEKARAASDPQTASQYILEAIEVNPQDSVLLSRAAELQLNMSQPVLAESYAVRSNAFAQTNRTLQLRNWLIIEHSREMRGDLLGVRSAHKKVQEYQY